VSCYFSFGRMCIVFVCHATHTRYRLVLAANRDEFVARATRPCALWDAEGLHGGLLAGRDEAGGGTWLGVQAETGRWAALTNVRELSVAPPGAPSRGSLPLQFLARRAEAPTPAVEDAVEDEVCSVAASASKYDGFNLLVGNEHEIWYMTNRAAEDAFQRVGEPAGADEPVGSGIAVRKVPPGWHVLSNAHLNTPWPKATRGRALFREVLEAAASPVAPEHRRRAREALARELLDRVLSDTVRPADSALPHTGVSCALERALSSVCVGPTYALAHTEQVPSTAPPSTATSGCYATVSQAVLLVEYNGEATLVERQMRPPMRPLAQGADDLGKAGQAEYLVGEGAAAASEGACQFFELQLPTAATQTLTP